MFDLAISVLCSSLIFVIFKLFTQFKVQTLYAIITNYFAAFTVGNLFYTGTIQLTEIPQKPWFWGAFALGLLFILVFNLMAATSQKLGVSVASVATKLSFVIPVVIGVFAYHEALNFYQITGIIMALVAVYFTSLRENTTSYSKLFWVLPILTFIGSGGVDAALAYFEKSQIAKEDLSIFSATLFGCAGSIGILVIFMKSFKDGFKINFRNIIGGICLGIPNFFSIYFLLRALNNKSLSSASLFTINNVAIVLFSTLLGIILFKEKLITKNWLGIGLAVLSILLVAKK